MCILLQVMFAMNCEKSETTRDSAYHLVFGMTPRSHPGSESKVFDEASDTEDVPANAAPSPQTPPHSTTSHLPIPAPRTTLRREASMTTACADDEIQFVPEPPPVPAPRAPRPVSSVMPQEESPAKMECDDDIVTEVSPIPVPRSSQPVPQPRTCPRADCDAGVVEANDSAVDELRAQSRLRAHQATLKSAERISNFYNRSKQRQVNSSAKLLH